VQEIKFDDWSLAMADEGVADAETGSDGFETELVGWSFIFSAVE
jgi:predicted transcriptional regulator